RKWKYWNRPKIENRNGASEKTFSYSECIQSALSNRISFKITLIEFESSQSNSSGS
ncbi:unnamed protein product, partial [Nesidiocoris tenuis]